MKQNNKSTTSLLQVANIYTFVVLVIIGIFYTYDYTKPSNFVSRDMFLYNPYNSIECLKHNYILKIKALNGDYEALEKLHELSLSPYNQYAKGILAEYYFQSKDYDKAFEIEKELVFDYNAVNLYRLAYMYENGIGTMQDIQKAQHFYISAALHSDLKYEKAICKVQELYKNDHMLFKNKINFKDKKVLQELVKTNPRNDCELWSNKL